MSQVDYFLKVDGCPGESEDSKHSSEIEVLDFAFDVHQSGSAAFGKGLGAGKVSMGDFSFRMKANTAGPKLFKACATGEHIPNAVLSCRKAGKEQQDYLVIKFNDLIVSGFAETGAGGNDPIPTQSISFNFSKIEYEYKAQNKDGTLGGPVKCHYDLKQNKGG